MNQSAAAVWYSLGYKWWYYIISHGYQCHNLQIHKIRTSLRLIYDYLILLKKLSLNFLLSIRCRCTSYFSNILWQYWYMYYLTLTFCRKIFLKMLGKLIVQKRRHTNVSIWSRKLLCSNGKIIYVMSDNVTKKVTNWTLYCTEKCNSLEHLLKIRW